MMALYLTSLSGVLLFALEPSFASKYTYSFKVHLTDSWFNVYGDGSEDDIYWRMCSAAGCGIFYHDIWNTDGATYSHTYEVPYNLGTITYVEIVHTGDDMLGIDWVEIEGTYYNPNTWDGISTIEYTGGSSTGCDILS